MALALIVYKNGPEDQQAETSRLFFFVGGIAALTLVINATTAKSLLFKLGLLGGDSAEKELVMEQIKKKLKKQLSVVFASIAKDYGFNDKELDEVRQACTLFADTDLITLLEIANKGVGTTPKRIINSTNTNATAQSSMRTRKKSLSNDNDNYSSTYNPILSSEVDSSTTTYLMMNQNSQDILDDIERTQSSLPISEQQQQRGRKGSTASAGSGIVDDELGGGGGGRGRRVSAADHFKRRLSIDVRGPSPVMTAQLLKYVRSIFLSMVRVSYWHDIEQGKLPRKSKSAKFLLYSIEVGQEDAMKGDDGGGSDWRCIEDKLNSTPHEIKLLTMIENFIPSTYFYGFHSRYLNKLECNREERHVYMVTSFISAHEHAQRKLHDFIKVEEDDPHSPEEMKVIAESIISVR